MRTLFCVYFINQTGYQTVIQSLLHTTLSVQLRRWSRAELRQGWWIAYKTSDKITTSRPKKFGRQNKTMQSFWKQIVFIDSGFTLVPSPCSKFLYMIMCVTYKWTTLKDWALQGCPFQTQSWRCHLSQINLFTCGCSKQAILEHFTAFRVCYAPVPTCLKRCSWYQIQNKHIVMKINSVNKVCCLHIVLNRVYVQMD